MKYTNLLQLAIQCRNTKDKGKHFIRAKAVKHAHFIAGAVGRSNTRADEIMRLWDKHAYIK